MGYIVGFLKTFYDIVVNTVKSLIMAVEMVGGSITFLNNFFRYLPAAISAGVIIFLAVYVIRFLLLK